MRVGSVINENEKEERERENVREYSKINKAVLRIVSNQGVVLL